MMTLQSLYYCLAFCFLPAHVATLRYLGCYSDSIQTRDLKGFQNVTKLAGKLPITSSGSYASHTNKMSLELCTRICTQNRFAYLGLQYGVECYCANTYGAHGKDNEASCSMNCSGNPAQKCGGSYKISIYALEINVIFEYQMYRGQVSQITFYGSWSDDMPLGYKSVSVNSRMSCLHLCTTKSICRGAVYFTSAGICYLMRLWGVTEKDGAWPTDNEIWLPV